VTSTASPSATTTLQTEVATEPRPLTDYTYWVSRDTQNRAELAAGQRANVLFLGDSITDFLQNGNGAPLWTKYYAPLGALDFAIGGIRTSQVLWQVETGQVAMAAPKVIVLLIGSNNLGVGQPPEEVAEGIAKIVDELGAQLPNTRILLLGILPRFADPTDPFRPKITAVNQMISALDDGRRVFYRDIGAGFLSPDGSISPLVMPDGAHPSLFGYAIYTNAIWTTLMELLEP
jgi:lysophospholipase L1-like esterase